MITDNQLLEAAWAARKHAYAPYSQFHVGASILTKSGKIFTGCNVENASYGGTICAERTAILKAVSEGELKVGDLLKIAVAVKTTQAAAPCGMCRQVIEEFACEETEVLLSIEPKKVCMKIQHNALLPHSFNSKNLNEKKM